MEASSAPRLLRGITGQSSSGSTQGGPPPRPSSFTTGSHSRGLGDFCWGEHDRLSLKNPCLHSQLFSVKTLNFFFFWKYIAVSICADTGICSLFSPLSIPIEIIPWIILFWAYVWPLYIKDWLIFQLCRVLKLQRWYFNIDFFFWWMLWNSINWKLLAVYNISLNTSFGVYNGPLMC